MQHITDDDYKIDSIVEAHRDRDVDDSFKDERRAADGGLEDADYSGDIKYFHADAGDICLPGSEEDSAFLRSALRNALEWMHLDQYSISVPGRSVESNLWHSRIMAERLADLGQRIAIAAWNQGYRARHFEKRTDHE